MKKKDILVLNPGSTSTKIAVFRDKEKIFAETVDHPADKLEKFDEIVDQESYRKRLIVENLADSNYDMDNLAAVVGRGGMVVDLDQGGYKVTLDLYNALKDPRLSPHASNLGGILAYDIANDYGIPAYIYDSVMGCEIMDIAKITGLAEIEKYGCVHVLNMRAQALHYAESIGKTPSDLNLIVVHMGGGITTCAMEKGVIIDTGAYDDGPMSPERSGGLPLLLFKDLIFDHHLTRQETTEKIIGKTGMYSYLGTKDCREVEERVVAGDEKAKLVYEAMAYQIAKSVADMSVPLKGKIDAIILTGGIAFSEMFCDMIEEYCAHIGKIVRIPGEHEMEGLAMGTARILWEGEKAKEYNGRYGRNNEEIYKSINRTRRMR